MPARLAIRVRVEVAHLAHRRTYLNVHVVRCCQWLVCFWCLLNQATQESIFAMKKNILRAIIEVGFIIFLFYSNLLMGEFERSGMGQKRGVAWAIGDVLTAANFEIATIAALSAYILFEFLRKRF